MTTPENIIVFTASGKDEKRIKDNDGLHKRRGIWHFKLKVAGRWKELSTHTSNYQEARRYRNKMVQDQEAGRLPNDLAQWTFARAAEHWIETRKKMVSPGTWRIDKQRLAPLQAMFADKRLIQITSLDISNYQVKRLEKVRPSTINSEIKALRLILKSARLWSRVSDEYKPLRESKQGPGRALSPEDEGKLFRIAMSNPEASAAYFAALVAGNTSARGCELRRLRLKDVDLINRTMIIRREDRCWLSLNSSE